MRIYFLDLRRGLGMVVPQHMYDCGYRKPSTYPLPKKFNSQGSPYHEPHTQP